MALHDRFGVQEYWIADRARKCVEAWERTGQGLRRKAVLSAPAGDALSTRLLPGLEIRLAGLFQD